MNTGDGADARAQETTNQSGSQRQPMRAMSGTPGTIASVVPHAIFLPLPCNMHGQAHYPWDGCVKAQVFTWRDTPDGDGPFQSAPPKRIREFSFQLVVLFFSSSSFWLCVKKPRYIHQLSTMRFTEQRLSRLV